MSEPMTDNRHKRYITAKELKTYINLSKATIYDLVRRRKIPFIPFGRKILFEIQSVDKWMLKRLVKSIDSIDDNELKSLERHVHL